MSLSWLFFVAVPAVLLTALLVHAGAVTGTWWYRTLSARSVGWVVIAFGVVTVSAGLLTTCPRWARVPASALTGVVNAWLWVRIADSVLCRRAARPRVVPIAPVGLAALFVLVLVGAAAGFDLSRTQITALASTSAASWPPSTPGPGVAGIAPSTATPLFVVTGFDTRWDGVPRHHVRLGLPQRRFSYKGSSRSAPRPYLPEDTHRSLVDLVRELARQVDAYHRESGRHLTVVAESGGALIAKPYLAATPDAPVDNLVLLSPLLAPGRVYYPGAGDRGWASAGGLASKVSRGHSVASRHSRSAPTPRSSGRSWTKRPRSGD